MKTVKPLSTRKPPAPGTEHGPVRDWIADARPGLTDLLTALDARLRAELSSPRYAVKWSKAYYGSEKNGWCIEVAAYDVSLNIVFLNGAALAPVPELGSGDTRYVKIRTREELDAPEVQAWIRQACRMPGWAWTPADG